MNAKKLLLSLVLFGCALAVDAQNPPPDSAFVVGDFEICAGECGQFAVVGLDPDGGYTFVWTQSFQTDGGPDFFYTTEEPSVLHCTGSFGGVIGAAVGIIGADGQNWEIFFDIIINESPPIDIFPLTSCPGGGPGGGCAPVCANATVTYSVDSFWVGTQQIIWEVGGAESFEVSPDGSQVEVTWGGPGQGIVSASVFNSFCPSFGSICVDVLEDPVASFSTNPPPDGDVLNICAGQVVQFENTSQFASGYQWVFGNGESSEVPDPETGYPSPGTYEVTLIAFNDCRCADTSKLTVNVSDLESPFVDCVSTICENTVQTYSSDADCGLFEWTVSANGAVIDGGDTTDNFITVDWGAGPEGTIGLQVADCAGGDFCLEPTSVTAPIISDAAEIEGPAEVCRGATAVYELPAYEGVAFEWSLPGLGAIIGGQGTHRITVQWPDFLAGEPQLVTVAYDNCWLGCSGADTLTVNMRPGFFATGAIEACPDATTNYAARNDQTFTAVAADWAMVAPDGTTTSLAANTTDLAVTWPDDPGTYRLLVTPSQPDDFCTDSYEISVRIAALPPPVTAINGSGFICPGRPYTYQAESGLAEARFRWTVNDGGTVTFRDGEAVNITWGATPPYELSVVQIAPGGPACASAPVDRVIEALPPFTIEGPEDVCEEGTDVFTTAFYEAVTYEWQVTPSQAGTVIAANDNEVEILWHRPGAATVALAVCGQNVDFAVDVLPKPRPVVNHPDRLCPNVTTNVATNLAYASYTWNDEDGNEVAADPDPELGPGYYSLIVEDANGCRGDTTFYIGAYPESVISISTPDDTGFCPDEGDPPRTLYAVNTDVGYTYQWLFDGAPIPGATGETYSTSDFGDYSVRITDQNGCTFISNKINLFEFCGFPGVCTGGTCTLPLNCDPGTDIRFGIQPTPQCNVRQYVNESPNYVPGSLQWDFDDPQSGAANNSTLESPTHTYSKAGFYVVLLTGLTPQGGANVLCWDARVDTVFAAAAFEYDGVCPGGEVQFEDLSTHLPFTSISSWEWNFGDPASGADNTASDPNPVHVYAAPGLYTVSLTITSSEGCTSTATQEVEIYPLPDVFFEAPDVSCEATALAFEAEVSANVTDVIWDFGDPGSGEANRSELRQPYKAYDLPGDYTVTLTATSIYGCEHTFSRVITVEPNALAGTISLSPASTVCEGETVILSAPAGGVSWVWSTGAATETITTTEAGTFEVTVTDADGCTYSPEVAAVDVLPLPASAVRAVAYNDFNQPEAFFYENYETCAGEDVFLETDAVPGYLFSWSNGDSGPETEFSEARGNLLGEGTHDVTLTIADTNTGCSNEVIFTVVVHPLPAAVTIEADQAGVLCEGTSVTLSVTSPQPGISYVWGNGWVGAAITTDAPGEYRVRAVNAFGCSVESNVLTIEAGPNVSLIPGGCHTRCRPDTLCFPELPDVVSYQWFFEGQPISGGSDPELIPEESGSYYVELTDDQGCVLQSEPLTLDLFDGIGNIEGQVYFDINNNGVIDAADTLLPAVDIFLFEGGAPAGGANAGPNGQYAFQGIPAADYTLVLDSLSLPAYFFAYQPTQEAALQGCNQTVSLDWLVYLQCPEDTTTVNLQGCPGSSVTYDGVEFAVGSTTLMTYSGLYGCDSLVAVSVAPFPLDTTNLSFSACAGESVSYAGENLPAGSATTFVYTGQDGCDSTVMVSVAALTPDTVAVQLSACSGESIEYNGVTLAAGANESFLFTNANGCDSLVQVAVALLPVDTAELVLTTCPDEAVTYAGMTLTPGMEMDFTFANQSGCDSLVRVRVAATAEAEMSLTTEASCPGLASGLVNITPESGTAPFRYSPDGLSFSATPQLNNLPAGSGTVFVEDANGCLTEWPYTIDARPELLAIATDTILPCDALQTTVRIEVLSGAANGVTYQWADGTVTSERLVTEPGVYAVSVTNECETLTLPVEVVRARDAFDDLLFVPNAFSPNGDGYNDRFRAQTGGDVLVTDFQLDLFDRWGNHLYRSEDIGEGWNGEFRGEAMDTGVYVWRITARVLACGQPERLEVYGDVTLLR